MCAKDLHMKDY